MSEGEHTAPKDFGAFRDRLHRRFESLSPQLRRIARHAVGKPSRLALQTVAEAASEMRVQPSTLVRFAKLFGFTGFSDMRELLRRRLLEAEDAFRERARRVRGRMRGAEGADPSEILDAMSDASVLGIERLAADVDAGALREALRLMGAAGCIHVYGRGRAQPVAACLAQGLIELRRRCLVLDANPGTLRNQVEAMTPAELMIAVAFEADSDPAIHAMSSARARGVPVLALTDGELGPFSGHASVNIAVRCSGIDGVAPLAPYIVLAQSLIVALGLQRPDNHDPGAETL